MEITTNSSNIHIKFEKVWLFLVFISTAGSSIYIPLKIVLNLGNSPTLQLLDWVITIIFIADIFVNLRVFNEEYELAHVLQNKNTGTKYYFSLIVDVFSAFPFFLLLPGSIFELLRLLKLVRIAQILRFWRQKFLRASDFLSLGFFAFWILILVHWFSCGWIVLYKFKETQHNADKYLTSLYWCVQTFTTVGYGDITPQNHQQLIYSIVVMLFGVGVYGYLIGNVASILSKRDPAKTQFFQNLEKLKAFINYRYLPSNIQKRIRDYYTYIWKNKLGYDETSFLSELPLGLKNEVSLYLKRDMIKRISLFQNIDDNFLREVSIRMRPLIFTPGDFIFKKGDKGNEMYFVIKGNLEVITDTGTINTLTDGDFFGEIALFQKVDRTASVRALSYSDLYILEGEVFEKLLSRYPEIEKEIKKTAEQRTKF
jgi:Cyclic nucleotide-binding domain/Ion transport protein